MDNRWNIIGLFQPHPSLSKARQLVGLQRRRQLPQNLEGSAPVVFTNASHGHAKTYGTRFQEGLVWDEIRPDFSSATASEKMEQLQIGTGSQHIINE